MPIFSKELPVVGLSCYEGNIILLAENAEIPHNRAATFALKARFSFSGKLILCISHVCKSKAAGTKISEVLKGPCSQFGRDGGKRRHRSTQQAHPHPVLHDYVTLEHRAYEPPQKSQHVQFQSIWASTMKFWIEQWSPETGTEDLVAASWVMVYTSEGGVWLVYSPLATRLSEFEYHTSYHRGA